MSAHEENADDCKSDNDGCLDTSRCSRKFCLECVHKVLDVNCFALIVEAHHTEACCCVGEADDKSERADKECPVETCNHDEQKQNDEHRGSVQQGATVLGGIFAFIRDGLEYGACHHYEQEREPE